MAVSYGANADYEGTDRLPSQPVTSVAGGGGGTTTPPTWGAGQVAQSVGSAAAASFGAGVSGTPEALGAIASTPQAAAAINLGRGLANLASGNVKGATAGFIAGGTIVGKAIAKTTEPVKVRPGENVAAPMGGASGRPPNAGRPLAAGLADATVPGGGTLGAQTNARPPSVLQRFIAWVLWRPVPGATTGGDALALQGGPSVSVQRPTPKQPSTIAAVPPPFTPQKASREA